MARVIESMDDQIKGVVTIDLGCGQRICVSREEYLMNGLARVVREHAPDYRPADDRLPLYQGGHRVGSLPAMFDPLNVGSSHFMYQPRPGDFRRTDAGWEADPRLGLGDLQAVAGFVQEI